MHSHTCNMMLACLGVAVGAPVCGKSTVGLNVRAGGQARGLQLPDVSDTLLLNPGLALRQTNVRALGPQGTGYTSIAVFIGSRFRLPGSLEEGRACIEVCGRKPL